MDNLRILEILNKKLEQDGIFERFELKMEEYEDEVFEMLVIKNKQDELSIVLSCYDDGWNIEYLGTHEHWDFVDEPQDVLEAVYNERIIPVLKRDLVAVNAYVEEYEAWLGSDMIVPKQIPFEFSKEEVEEAKAFKILNWDGEITDEKVRCYVLSERPEVAKFQEEFLEDYFEKQE